MAMLQHTTGIVLRTIKYNDASVIADIFTEQQGRVSYLVKLPRARKSPSRSVLFQPLSVLTYESDFRPRLNLQRLKDARPLCLFTSLPYDPYKSAIALFLAEFLNHALHEETANAPLFAYLCNSLQWLDGARTPVANFHLVFLMRMSRFLGLYPNLDDYHPGDCFDLRAACFARVQPLHSDVVRPDEAGRMGMLMRMNYASVCHEPHGAQPLSGNHPALLPPASARLPGTEIARRAARAVPIKKMKNEELRMKNNRAAVCLSR